MAERSRDFDTVTVKSWVVVRLEDDTVLFETFSPSLIAALNLARYRAIPIGEYLADVNRRIRARQSQRAQASV